MVYCVAGFGPTSDWYRNVRADPHVLVWLPARRFAGIAEDISDDPQRLALLRAVLLASGFAAPAAGIPVRRLGDAELARLTAHYRVLRIVPKPDGSPPGSLADLAWVWWLVGAAGWTLTLAMRRHRRRADTRTAP